MKKLFKLAIASALLLSTATICDAAKADEKDGTVERFVCIGSGNDSGNLHSAFVKLNAKDASQGFGYGGGDMALKLSNNGYDAPDPNRAYAGGTVTFNLNKKNSLFQIYFKPVDVDLSHIQLTICLLKRSGAQDVSFGPFNAFPVRAVGNNGWFVLEEDFADLPGALAGAEIERISYKLLGDGDNGHVLIGKTLISNRKDILSPSLLILDKLKCGSPGTVSCPVSGR